MPNYAVNHALKGCLYAEAITKADTPVEVDLYDVMEAIVAASPTIAWSSNQGRAIPFYEAAMGCRHSDAVCLHAASQLGYGAHAGMYGDTYETVCFQPEPASHYAGRQLRHYWPGLLVLAVAALIVALAVRHARRRHWL
jgi:hypothetical protein